MQQWSVTMTVSICLYVLFIMVVLTISFPLKSYKTKVQLIQNERANGIAELNDDADGLGRNEQKLLQRARDTPNATNRSDILRGAFKK